MSNNVDDHLVILLHGLAKKNSSMKSLESFLKNKGYETLNLSYPSTKYPIDKLIDIVHNSAKEYICNYNQVSFVSFSMGGLVTRAYLHKYKIPNLSKVVMIGTPNNGSEVADFFSFSKSIQKFCGPVLNQLVTDQSDFEDIFGEIYYDCGIIAGDLPIDFCYPIMKHTRNDGKVSVESTKLENMTDHITFKLPHFYMTRSKKVWHATANFLEKSKF